LKKSERHILTNRFIDWFNHTSEMGDIRCSQVAKLLGITEKTINRYLKKIDLITFEDAFLICEQYQVKTDYMFKDITNWETIVADKLKRGFMSPNYAIGGNIITHQSQQMTQIDSTIPKNKKQFPAKGDSMTNDNGGIDEGDKIETEQIYNTSDIKEGDVVVIEDENGTCVKRVTFLKNNCKEITGFICHSDLPFYSSYETQGSEKTKVYKLTNLIKESRRIELRKAIGKNKLKVVFDSLIEILHEDDEFITLQARFIELNQQINKGITERNDIKEIQGIRMSLLNKIGEIPAKEFSKIRPIN
jgi:tricorn protease-like protein